MMKFGDEKGKSNENEDKPGRDRNKLQNQIPLGGNSSENQVEKIKQAAKTVLSEEPMSKERLNAYALVHKTLFDLMRNPSGGDSELVLETVRAWKTIHSVQDNPDIVSNTAKRINKSNNEALKSEFNKAVLEFGSFWGAVKQNDIITLEKYATGKMEGIRHSDFELPATLLIVKILFELQDMELKFNARINSDQMLFLAADMQEKRAIEALVNILGTRTIGEGTAREAVLGLLSPEEMNSEWINRLIQVVSSAKESNHPQLKAIVDEFGSSLSLPFVRERNINSIPGVESKTTLHSVERSPKTDYGPNITPDQLIAWLQKVKDSFDREDAGGTVSES